MAVRQDSWTADDDLILAEVTLRHIREGGTQLKAFEEVGERIGRTAAACGFRWNSTVRKRYEEAIRLAKMQRQNRNKAKQQAQAADNMLEGQGSQETAMISRYGAGESSSGNDAINLDAVIRYLKDVKQSQIEMQRKIRSLEKELAGKNEKLKELEEENERLSRQVNDVQSDYRVVNDDYKTLIQIMDRARKMALLSEEDEQHKPKFKMDANGNLERVE